MIRSPIVWGTLPSPRTAASCPVSPPFLHRLNRPAMPSAYPLPLGFSRRHALLALLLFGIELLIGTLLDDGFIRPFVGDVLVVMLIYCLIRTWIRLPAIPLASAVLLFATLVETG